MLSSLPLDLSIQNMINVSRTEVLSFLRTSKLLLTVIIFNVYHNPHLKFCQKVIVLNGNYRQNIQLIINQLEQNDTNSFYFNNTFSLPTIVVILPLLKFYEKIPTWKLG